MNAIRPSKHIHFCKSIEIAVTNFAYPGLMEDMVKLQKLYDTYIRNINELNKVVEDYKRTELSMRKNLSYYSRRINRMKKMGVSGNLQRG